ncbi:MAG: MBL fold metallo-hydrolase [Nanoarchaeota archaeon]|nr:MBL fold metallo-hydrolase [Nanoarchaeota archaeon]
MEICTVGGYEEVGKNMTAVKVGEDVILIDCGFFLPGVIELQEHHELNYTTRGLRRVGGIPDDRVLDDLGWRNKVKAIVFSHAHLDHIGGLPFLIDRYPNAQLFGTPFTMKVLESLIEDAKVMVPNKMNIVKPNSTHAINSELKIEFIHVTHSTLECSLIAIHTKKGIFFYTLDFKFDDHPIIENPPNYSRLKEIGKIGVKVLIMNSLYAAKEEPNGGESDAAKMLQEAFNNLNEKKDSAIFITTFSSHIERLTTIVNLAQKTGREIIFLGRSLEKYVRCAIEIGKCPFKNKIKIMKYRRQVESMLKKIEQDRGKYVVVCTGHQGEKNSILDRIVKKQTHFIFRPGDNLIFSTSIIPTEVNIEARKILDAKLKKLGVNLQTNVHVHGHGSKHSKEKILDLLKPEFVIPSHASIEQEKDMMDVAKEKGYVPGKTVFLVKNGKTFNF